MERKPLLAGNWKMHMTIEEARQLAGAIAQGCTGVIDREVMIAPPFTALAPVAQALHGSPVQLAGQNVCWEEKGAFTAEISPIMLRDAGCSMAIIGHSERRQIFGEDNAMINKRLKGALAHGLIPVLCIGETLEERQGGRMFDVLTAQLKEGLAGAELADHRGVVIAYEPVWAIGTGQTATTEQAQEAHKFIRQLLGEIVEKTVASGMRILYGGSVNPDNIDSLMAQADVDGALVGGAALKADSFERIIKFQ